MVMNVNGHRIVAVDIQGRAAYELVSVDGRTRATVVPDLAMLCWSLTRDGQEFLGRPNAIDAFAASWATTGIPLLHPWANRLGGDRIAGVESPTIVSSPLVPRDDNGLPIHGLNLAGAGWRVRERSADAGVARLAATLSFARPELLAIFPFPHELAVSVVLAGDRLEVETTVTARGDRPMPVAFGWHPYFAIPGVPRTEWVVSLPVSRQAELDGRMLPTGIDRSVMIPPGPLRDTTYDDMFTRLRRPARFALTGGGRAVHVEFGDGYPIAQVYAPASRDVIAFEPMTAPTNALVTGNGLSWVSPGERYSARFSVRVTEG
jgi:galactose mutarotase-like enzyme